MPEVSSTDPRKSPASAVELDIGELTFSEWHQYCCQQGWADGLPTLPPLKDDVLTFVASSGVHRKVIGPIPPSQTVASIVSVAANALMAGCVPAHLPVICAALDALLSEQFNLFGVLATTHPCTQLAIVNGPIRSQLRLNSGANCMGQGAMANAAIGRAIRLVLGNLGGAEPGVLDRATQGTPAKFSFCIAENEEQSPWLPWSVRRGFQEQQSVVSVLAAEGPHNINDHGSVTGDGLLTTIASVMATSGSNNFYLGGEHAIILGPEHAQTLSRDGWDPDSIARELHRRARVPVSEVSPGKRKELAALGIEPQHQGFTLAGGPESIQVLVAGGEGKHSVWIPTFGSSRLCGAAINGVSEDEGK